MATKTKGERKTVWLAKPLHTAIKVRAAQTAQNFNETLDSVVKTGLRSK